MKSSLKHMLNVHQWYTRSAMRPNQGEYWFKEKKRKGKRCWRFFWNCLIKFAFCVLVLNPLFFHIRTFLKSHILNDNLRMKLIFSVDVRTYFCLVRCILLSWFNSFNFMHSFLLSDQIFHLTPKLEILLALVRTSTACLKISVVFSIIIKEPSLFYFIHDWERRDEHMPFLRSLDRSGGKYSQPKVELGSPIQFSPAIIFYYPTWTW